MPRWLVLTLLQLKLTGGQQQHFADAVYPCLSVQTAVLVLVEAANIEEDMFCSVHMCR